MACRPNATGYVAVAIEALAVRVCACLTGDARVDSLLTTVPWILHITDELQQGDKDDADLTDQ